MTDGIHGGGRETGAQPQAWKGHEDEPFLPVCRQLCDFSRKLADQQELLGPEFERVLYDNIWELYAR